MAAAPPSKRKPTPAILAAIAAACAVAAPVTMKWEGKRNRAYWDPVHIATICYGHTGPEVKIGLVWSDGTCRDVLSQDQQKAAWAAASCLPDRVIFNRYVMGSVVDFALNRGGAGFCRSSMAHLFAAGRLADGCRYYSAYRFAHDRNGKVVELPGLKGRRADETRVCLQGVGL